MYSLLLTTGKMKHRSTKKHFVLGFVASTNISALHPEKAEYHGKEC